MFQYLILQSNCVHRRSNQTDLIRLNWEQGWERVTEQLFSDLLKNFLLLKISENFFGKSSFKT